MPGPHEAPESLKGQDKIGEGTLRSPTQTELKERRVPTRRTQNPLGQPLIRVSPTDQAPSPLAQGNQDMTHKF